MVKQKQVDEAVGSESGGSRSVGHGDGMIESIPYVNPEREGDEYRMTGIYVRAMLDGKWGTWDIAPLHAESLITWLRSFGGYSPVAENTIGILLGIGHISELVPPPSAILSALAATTADAPALSSSEGTATQSDSTKEEV